MRQLSALWFTLRSLLFRRRLDDELDQELQYHLQREAELYERQGLSPNAARREAVRRFGGVQRHREEARDVRRLGWLDDLRADLRFTGRLMRLYPVFSLNVIGIVALGIAACATTFSLVSGILLSPFPFPNAERVYDLQLRSAEGSSTAALPVEAYLRIARDSGPIEAIAASSPDGAAVEWNGEPERVRTRRVTPSFFRVFAVRPVAGRVFSPDEEAESAPVAILGHEVWRTRFRSDPAVLGTTIALDDVAHVIVGVMPPRFRAEYTIEPDLWLPMRVTEGGTAGRNTVNAVVRLAAGVTQVQAESRLAAMIRARMPSTTFKDSVEAKPSLVPISTMILGDVGRPLRVLLGAVVLVLLLVAANVATMFLARSAARRRELGVRRALGASRGRQLRQLVTESATLTLIGGAAGVLASYWAVSAIRGLGVRVLPRMDAVSVDWRVLLFALAGTILTGAIGGLAPALATRKAAATMRDAAGSRLTGQRTSSALVVVQITLSVVLLVGAGLLVKSFLRVVPDDPGFALENRATVNVALRGAPAFPDTSREASRAFVRDVSDRMRRVPGVRDVAVMSFVPFFGSVSIADVEIPGRPAPDRPLTAFQNLVTPNFFEVMRIPLRRGRAFTPGDIEGAERVAIINETAARRWWPDASALGRQVMLSRASDRFAVTIVGIAGDGRLIGTDTRVRPEIYLPVAQHNPRFLSFIAHTSVPPRVVARDLQRAVWSVAPRLAIGMTSDLASIALDSVRRSRFFSWAMGTFAVVAVALAALAVYGLLGFAVVQRRQEIGIRLALGATPRRVGALVLRRAVGLAVAGVVPGVLLARALSRFMESLLLEVSATDAVVFLGTGLAMLAVSVVAACAPMYQATRVDPMQSLRV